MQKINWRPTADILTLKIRAELADKVRHFFRDRQVLEVETPILTAGGSTEIHLDQFETKPDGRGQRYRLNTSPELAMKRLLAAGSGDIYQLGKVFRDNEQGRRHEPEFTLLEWYRLGFDMPRLMLEVEQLLSVLLGDGLSQPTQTLTYQQAFMQAVQLDPLRATRQQLVNCYQLNTRSSAPDLENVQAYLDLIMSQLVEPQFDRNRITFVTHYPAAQASLARLSPDNPLTAERFEVFAGGLELANGFHELTDYHEQHTRMQQEIQQRKEMGKQAVDMDERFLAALKHGLPDCSGVALGFDRVVMLVTQKSDIQQVMSFSSQNN